MLQWTRRFYSGLYGLWGPMLFKDSCCHASSCSHLYLSVTNQRKCIYYFFCIFLRGSIICTNVLYHDSNSDECCQFYILHCQSLHRIWTENLCVCIFVLSSLLGCANSDEMTTERVHSALEEMFKTLRGLSHTRDHLKQLRSIYTASDGVHQVRHAVPTLYFQRALTCHAWTTITAPVPYLYSSPHTSTKPDIQSTKDTSNLEAQLTIQSDCMAVFSYRQGV